VQSVPFEIKEVHGGFSEARGAAYVEGDALVLEVQTSLLGLFPRPPRAYRVELVDLEEVRHKRGLRRDRVTIRTRPLDRITGVPGAGQGELCLFVKRSHRAALDTLLDRLDLWRTTE